MTNEQKLVMISNTLCGAVVEASPNQVRKEIAWAISEVREMGYEIDSPLETCDDLGAEEPDEPVAIDVDQLPEELRAKYCKKS